MTIFELIDAGDATAIRELLQRDPEAVAAHDDQGLTVVMRAAYRGGEVFEVVRAASPPLEPFDRIVVGQSQGLPAPDAWTPDGFTALHLAAYADNTAAARALLEAGADADVLSTASFAQVTPLGTAAFAGANGVARLLLDHGADPRIAGAGGGTPLDTAMANGNEELEELLRSRMQQSDY